MINNKIIGKKFAIYGLGLTGISTLKYLKRLKVKKVSIWDDNYQIRKKFKIKSNKKKFLLNLNKIDYIVISPGINISKIDLKKNISKIKNKIITDLDLFYISNPDIKSIVVTGTNGKSTTCKILQCLLKNNTIQVPYDNPLMFIDGIAGITLYRKKPYQVQLFICEPNNLITEHSHPNIDSYEMFLYGMQFSHKGKIIIDKSNDTFEYKND